MKKQLLFFNIVLVFLLFLATGNKSMAQTNIAPACTITGVGLSTGTLDWSRVKDLDTGTTSSGQQCWISTGTPPSSTPGVEWWAFTWPSAQSIAKVKFYLAQNTARTLTGCTMQRWDGTNWVTFNSWVVPQGPFSFTISFNPVVTTAIRFTSFQMTGSGQQSNPNFREIEVITGSLSNNDIGVTTFNTPGQFCSPGSLPVNVTLSNFGLNQVTSATVNWSVNNVLQTPYVFSGLLDTINGTNPSTASIALGSYTFPSTSVNIKVWSESPNAMTDTIRTNDTVSVNKAPSMSGSYTINPSGSGASNFLTFDAAISAMVLNGICAPVDFTVAPGTYTRTSAIVVPDIVGANSVNTITFDGVNASTRIITGSIASSAVVILNSSKYVTFKNFTITNTSATTPVGFAMVGSTRSNTLRRCNINVPIQTGTSSVGYTVCVTGTSNGAGQSACSADSIVIDSNVITGGGYGITVYGASSAGANRGIVITNNTVNSVNYMGGYIAYNYNPIVLKNNTFMLQGASYGYYGLYFYYNQNSNANISHEVIGNKILNWSGYGIYLYYPAANATAAKIKVYNNVVSSSNGGYNQGIYGIYFIQQATGCTGEMYHNTILMNGAPTSTSYTCLYHSGSTATIIKNNIFGVYGGVAVPVYMATSTTGNTLNYNNYYNANPSGSLVYRNAVFYTAANYLNAANGGDSSFSTLPSFVSRVPLPGNYALTDGCDGYGVDLSAIVPTDINGLTRSVTPNPGAYEFNGGVSDNLRLTQLLTPAPPITLGSQDLKFVVKNIGNNSVTSYNASYRLGTATPVTIVQTNTIGVCGLDTAVFTGSNQISLAATNSLAVYTDSPNSNPDADKTNDTLKVTLYGPLSGVYTVGGTTPDFATPQLAAAALQYGVGGPVTFDIRPGTYSGQVIVNGPILGASDSIRVTFEGNNNTNRIFTANVAGATFLLNNANYVTVQNLKVINTNTSTPVGIGVVGAGSSYATRGIKIRKCDVSVPIQTSTSSTGYVIMFTGTSNATGVSSTGADSSEIDSNIVTGGGYGIVHYGSQNAAYNRGLKIRGNTINNCNYMGMYIYYNYNPVKVLNNTINMQGQNYGYYGMYFYYNQSASTTESHEIIGNRINNFGGYGMYLYYPMQTTTAAKIKVYNNILVGTTVGVSYPGYYGIYLYQYTTACAGEVFHNTIVMNNSNATSTSYTGFYNTGSTLTNVKNNIFSVLAGSYTPMYLATSPTGNVVNYNIYYNNASATLLYRGGNFTAATYKTATAGGDTSYNMVPPFVSATNFQITNGCIRGADVTASVPTDFAGNARGIPGNIGAYEYPGISVDITPTAILAPSFPVSLGSQDVQVLVRNNGNTTITSFDLSYQLNGGLPVTTSFSGSLASCDTVSVYFTGTQQINLVNASNTLRVYTANPNAGADGYAVNDTMSQSISTPMIGSYIIGTAVPNDYPTFNAAVTALQIRGVGGPVEFRVRTGTYTESVDIKNIIGISPSSNIVFRSMANHRDSVTLQYNTATGGIGQVLNLGSSYITFRSMAITQLSDQGSVINIAGTVADSIDNCKVTGQTYSSTSSQYLIKANGTPTDSIVIRGSLLQGYTYYGLYVYQTSIATANKNWVIENNTIQNMGYTYITYFYYTQGLNFRNNTITAGTGTTSGYLYFYYTNDGFKFLNNYVTMNRTTNYTYLGYYSQNTAANRGLIANNVFNYTATSSSGTPYLGYASNYLSYINNTFRSTNSTYGVGYYVNYNCIDFEFKNNIVYSTTQYAMNWYQLPSSNKIDNNTYYTPNTVFLNITSPATTYPNIQAYKIATLASKADYNSISFDPGFTSTTNLIPSATSANSWSVNGRAAHDSRVTTDFNGLTRPATLADGVPDVGAYEFTPTSTPPLATAVPTTPVAGGTQSFLFGGDTVAKITYDVTATAPTSMGMRVYSGVTPPLIGTATAYPYYYVSAVAPTGTYNYNATINFKRIWLGTLPTVADLKFATKAPASGWLVLLGTNSTVDSVLNTITTAMALSDLPAVFTAADDLNPLPVELIKFSGVKVDRAAKLNWATATEVNSNRFEIESSYDGKNFKYIGKVKANGNSSSLKAYSFVDEKAFAMDEPVVYYRLKMVDLDGSFDYSSVITVNNSEVEPATEVNVFPNPFNDKVYVELKLDADQTIELRDLSGRLVFTQELSSANEIHELNIPSDVNKGIYFLVLGSNQQKVSKLIKN